MEIPNKFHNAKIYRITDIGYTKCYIGSTTEELSQRMARHRTKYKKFLRDDKEGHTRSYDLFNEYGIENCKIELIEYFKCDTLAELRKKEGEHIKNTECVNKRVAGRTKKEYNKEYREQNKDKIKEYYENNKDKIKDYYENNKDKICDQKKEYKKLNKDKICEQKREYYQNNKDRICDRVKEYREQNKAKINEKKKEYYELNKDEMNAKQREKRKQQKADTTV